MKAYMTCLFGAAITLKQMQPLKTYMLREPAKHAETARSLQGRHPKDWPQCPHHAGLEHGPGLTVPVRCGRKILYNLTYPIAVEV